MFVVDVSAVLLSVMSVAAIFAVGCAVFSHFLLHGLLRARVEVEKEREVVASHKALLQGLAASVGGCQDVLESLRTLPADTQTRVLNLLDIEADVAFEIEERSLVLACRDKLTAFWKAWKETKC